MDSATPFSPLLKFEHEGFNTEKNVSGLKNWKTKILFCIHWGYQIFNVNTYMGHMGFSKSVDKWKVFVASITTEIKYDTNAFFQCFFITSKKSEVYRNICKVKTL